MLITNVEYHKDNDLTIVNYMLENGRWLNHYQLVDAIRRGEQFQTRDKTTGILFPVEIRCGMYQIMLDSEETIFSPTQRNTNNLLDLPTFFVVGAGSQT